MHFLAIEPGTAVSKVPLRQISSGRRNGLNSAAVVGRREVGVLLQNRPRPLFGITLMSASALLRGLTSRLILVAFPFIQHIAIVFLRLDSAFLLLWLRRVRRGYPVHLRRRLVEQLIPGILGRLAAQIVHLLNIELRPMLVLMAQVVVLLPSASAVGGGFANGIGVGELQPRRPVVLIAVVV